MVSRTLACGNGLFVAESEWPLSGPTVGGAGNWGLGNGVSLWAGVNRASPISSRVASRVTPTQNVMCKDLNFCKDLKSL